MASKLLILTRPELDHILAMLEANKDAGDYYGNAKQYYARQDRIIAKLIKAIGPDVKP